MVSKYQGVSGVWFIVKQQGHTYTFDTCSLPLSISPELTSDSFIFIYCATR